MPNLDHQAVLSWLAELDSGHDGAPPDVRPIERDAAVAERLSALGSALDRAAADAASLSDALTRAALRTELQAVLAQLGAARAIRVLHWLAEIDLPSCHDALGALLRDGAAAGAALRSSIDAFTRRATLRRLYAPERIAALLEASGVLAVEAK